MLGNLVIIDTPGPNEAGENLRLAAVVAEQLKKSSMVLIVLDFTQLKTEAAEKVKEDVQQVIELLDQENLYVLVNKVDQRLEHDITPENELEQHPGISVVEMKTTEALAQQAFGRKWERELKKAGVEDLRSEAEDIWEDSGFDSFVKKAINALMAEAAPRCMLSALKFVQCRLVELHEDVNFASNVKCKITL